MANAKILIDMQEYERLKKYEKLCLESESKKNPDMEQGGSGFDSSQELADAVLKKDNGPSLQEPIAPVSVPIKQGDTTSMTTPDQSKNSSTTEKDCISNSEASISDSRKRWWHLV